jgi:hypothetical protein
MIDHGYFFNGPHWECMDAPVAGLYFRPQVYTDIRTWDDLQPWLDRILHFPEEVMDDAFRQVPPEWVENDAPALLRLLENLMNRRRRVESLLLDCFRARHANFPHWSER